jgi:hypothetical protein
MSMPLRGRKSDKKKHLLFGFLRVGLWKTAQLAATELPFLSIPKQDSQAEASQRRRAWKKLP